MLVLKFKKITEEKKVIISYLPVLGWFEAKSRKDAMVPCQEGSNYAGSLYSYASDYIIDKFGIAEKFLYNDEIETDIVLEEESDTAFEIDSYYIYTLSG